MDDAATDGNRDCLGAIVGSQLGHDVLDVNLNGSFRDKKFFGDIPVTIAFGNLLQNLNLAGCQPFIAVVVGEPSSYFGGDCLLAAVHFTNSLQQDLGRHALDDVACRSTFESSLHFNIAFRRCDNNDPGFRKLASDRDHGVDSVHVRQSYIQEHDIRSMLPKELNRFLARRSLGRQLHLSLIIDQRGNPFAHQRMIIDTENSDTLDIVHLGGSSPDFVMIRCDRQGYSLVSQLQNGFEDGRSNASLPGIQSRTTVPALARLNTLNRPPIRSALSRMFVKPQCPSLPDFSSPSSIPQPLSRTETRKLREMYPTLTSIALALECRNALITASRTMR